MFSLVPHESALGAAGLNCLSFWTVCPLHFLQYVLISYGMFIERVFKGWSRTPPAARCMCTVFDSTVIPIGLLYPKGRSGCPCKGRSGCPCKGRSGCPCKGRSGCPCM